MQATIFGVTPKVNIYKKELIDNFLKSETENFLSLKNQNALYQNKSLINTAGLNYLNLLPDNNVNLTLKNLILKEYSDCENLYPYLGDLFLEFFYDQKVKNRKTIYRYEKRNENAFIESLKNKNVKNIVNWIFKNINLERTINIQTHSGKDIAFETEDNFVLNISYDYDFYKGMSNLTFRNYKFIIINGYIESVGEIHHLLTKASENKVPYVFFCYGMSEEVKHNIQLNNRKGSFKVLPVSLDVNDENTLNILNDIAVLHNATIVSSDMGQTISQEVRKKLPVGNKITFFEGKICLDPVASFEKISLHKQFLIKRLEEAEIKLDVNTEPIKNRIKSFSMKRLNIYIPHYLKNNNCFQRELFYVLMFLRNINKKYKILYYNEREYYIPSNLIAIVVAKSKSLKETISNIEIVVS